MPIYLPIEIYHFIIFVLFIPGLLTLIGIILYIGAITEEAGNHTKSSMDNHPRFEYWYGASFVLTVTSFSSAELTGVLSVYLYISRHKHSYRKKVERLQSSSTANLDGEVSGGGEEEEEPRPCMLTTRQPHRRQPRPIRGPTAERMAPVDRQIYLHLRATPAAAVGALHRWPLLLDRHRLVLPLTDQLPADVVVALIRPTRSLQFLLLPVAVAPELSWHAMEGGSAGVAGEQSARGKPWRATVR